MRFLIALGILLSLNIFPAHSQTKKITKVVYGNFENGKRIPNSNFGFLYSDEMVYLSKDNAKIRYFADFKNRENVDIIKYVDQVFKTLSSFDSLPEPKFEDKADKILGYKCKYASYISFSNKIEVWYTENSKITGSPYRRYLPTEKALVLKVVINGNRTIIADSIIRLKNYKLPEFPSAQAKEISDAEFEELKIKSRYFSLKVFEDEIVNFDPDYWENHPTDTNSNQTFHFSKGTVIMKKISLPETLKEGANVFAKLTSNSNGDAYDRTASLFIIPEYGNKINMLDAFENGLTELPVYTDNNGKEYQGIAKTENYNPPVELMRFFTSFGVGHFNNLREINNYPWENAAIYNQDVTAQMPNNIDEIWIGVFIGNYDKGGHKLSLELNFYPSWEEEKPAEKWIQPLFSTVNIMEMSEQNYGRLFKTDTLKVDFEIPKNIENPQLIYTSTGHGGWGGGDEFNQKLNQIFVDGKLLYDVIPWRTDCATYRMFNPASGNFGNGMSSSDLSRSNWCPGTITNPYFIDLSKLKTGYHTMEIVIDQGEDEGGSFSHWGVTGVIVGEMADSEK